MLRQLIKRRVMNMVKLLSKWLLHLMKSRKKLLPLVRIKKWENQLIKKWKNQLIKKWKNQETDLMVINKLNN